MRINNTTELIDPANDFSMEENKKLDNYLCKMKNLRE